GPGSRPCLAMKAWRSWSRAFRTSGEMVMDLDTAPPSSSTHSKPLSQQHPIASGLADFTVRDEFYYRLKFAKPEGSIKPVLRVRIDDSDETVAWSWERPDVRLLRAALPRELAIDRVPQVGRPGHPVDAAPAGAYQGPGRACHRQGVASAVSS